MVNITEKRFDDQNQKIKDQIKKCRKVLDSFVNDFESQNDKMRAEIIEKSNHIHSQINKKRDEISNK